MVMAPEQTVAAAVVGVRAVVGIGGEVPEEDVPAPVAGDADHDAGDGLADAEWAVVIALGDGLLGEVDVLVGEGVVDFGHGVDGAAVEMEAGAGDVLGGGGVLKDGERVERVVEIVIVEDDPGLDAGLLEGGAEVVLDEDVLLGREHEHAGGVLFVEGLVLDGEGVDGDAFGLHALDVLDEVGGVGVEVLRAEGRRPGRGRWSSSREERTRARRGS